MAKSDEQIQKESTRRIEAAARKSLPKTTSRAGGIADWQNADPTIVMGLVCTVAAAGGAVRLGYTRDGGAYSIGLYLGDDSKTYYCNDAEGINERIKELYEDFNQ